MSLGIMGYTVGHEIGHGFDPTSHKLDLENSIELQEKNIDKYWEQMKKVLRHSLWNINSTDEEIYKRKIQCVEDDYGSQKVIKLLKL